MLEDRAHIAELHERVLDKRIAAEDRLKCVLKSFTEAEINALPSDLRVEFDKVCK